ncbi:MAG: hypothetical protein COA65_08570 [Rhodospirillaceae bacterium]|nr:MAG: hypothetical protein COA65_08570 [Rhodospirillaceae bacterium]
MKLVLPVTALVILLVIGLTLRSFPCLVLLLLSEVTLVAMLPGVLGLAGFSPAMAQKLGDFSTGIYAYQQKDYVTAYRLFEPLAKQGHSAAQYNLGRMYARGEGIPQNYIEAYKWFFLANKNGRKEGAQAMRALAKKLTDLQMKTAILRAGEECCALKR